MNRSINESIYVRLRLRSGNAVEVSSFQLRRRFSRYLNSRFTHSLDQSIDPLGANHKMQTYTAMRRSSCSCHEGSRGIPSAKRMASISLLSGVCSFSTRLFKSCCSLQYVYVSESIELNRVEQHVRITSSDSLVQHGIDLVEVTHDRVEYHHLLLDLFFELLRFETQLPHPQQQQHQHHQHHLPFGCQACNRSIEHTVSIVSLYCTMISESLVSEALRCSSSAIRSFIRRSCRSFSRCSSVMLVDE